MLVSNDPPHDQFNHMMILYYLGNMVPTAGVVLFILRCLCPYKKGSYFMYNSTSTLNFNHKKLI